MQRTDLVTESEIEEAYSASGNKLGWRFLYSPIEVLNGADVAFLGLNPGGRGDPKDHSGFAAEARYAAEAESAYVSERWNGALAGQSPLQLQVRSLFQGLGVEPERVLAGNLVPFRSASWAELYDKDSAVAFGCALWRRILMAVRPGLVIGMGRVATKHLGKILETNGETRVCVGWGRVAGTRAEFPGGVLVGLPHLSRFPIIGREKSKPAVAQLFGSAWRV
jgi:hypothetical protein